MYERSKVYGGKIIRKREFWMEEEGGAWRQSACDEQGLD